MDSHVRDDSSTSESDSPPVGSWKHTIHPIFSFDLVSLPAVNAPCCQYTVTQPLSLSRTCPSSLEHGFSLLTSLPPSLLTASRREDVPSRTAIPANALLFNRRPGINEDLADPAQAWSHVRGWTLARRKMHPPTAIVTLTFPRFHDSTTPSFFPLNNTLPPVTSRDPPSIQAS